jgi:hypothetical protein
MKPFWEVSSTPKAESESELESSLPHVVSDAA